MAQLIFQVLTLLIELYGIETGIDANFVDPIGLLIELYGIETSYRAASCSSFSIF